MIRQIRKNIEPIFWMAGLVFLALQNPNSTFSSICFFDIVGFKNCPGCGLGSSISYLFDGQIILSVQTHYLGIPIVIAITLRIIKLLKLRVDNQIQKSLSLGL